MSYAVSTRPILRSRENLRDEVLSRRSSFRSGTQVQLSDGQTWVLPAPPKKSEPKTTSFGIAYTDIIHAILEAEDRPEQCLGELSFAIFLLEQNYHLSPADYQRLLASSTSSSDLQTAFHQIAQEHVHAFLDFSPDCVEN
jgi:hypothetical protein